jgi:hypothetical protein
VAARKRPHASVELRPRAGRGRSGSK